MLPTCVYVCIVYSGVENLSTSILIHKKLEKKEGEVEVANENEGIS